MGLLGSALTIGRSALLSYQSALQVVGSNISSAGSADYTRLSPTLDPLQGRALGDGMQPGAGVIMSDIRRHVDSGLEQRLRSAIGEREDVRTQSELLAQVEVHFDDANGNGLSARLSEFFHTFDDLRHAPEDVAVRDLTIAQGMQLAEGLRVIRRDLINIGAQADDQVGALVDRVDELTGQVARLNQQITVGEAGHRGEDTGLRDQRDGLLRELAGLIDVTTREQPNGVINVYVGSEALVQGGAARTLSSEQRTDGMFVRTFVLFADTGAEINPRSGRLAGLIRTRDVDAFGRVTSVDELAGALIQDVNRIHADGQGLVGFQQVTSTRSVLDPRAALSSPDSGVQPPVQDGSFYVTVADDASHTPNAYRINVRARGDDQDTTLASLVDEINGSVVGVVASLDGQNRLILTAQGDYRFTFGYDGGAPRADTSNVLASLGINTFFTGRDASDIGVNGVLSSDPRFLAASSVFFAGDGNVAGRIAELSNAPSATLDGVSFSDFYGGVAGAVAVSAARANSDSATADAVSLSLQAQREAVSGVNLDEEAISLIRYQRSFQGAARYLSTVNDLVSELIALIN